MKTTHTHRGTCQACGAVQAVDNTTALVAKHGYKVHHIFVGTCPGSDQKPAEFEISYLQYIVRLCDVTATEHERVADLYRTRTLMVYSWTKSEYIQDKAYSPRRGWVKTGHYVEREYPMFGCYDFQIEDEYNLRVREQEASASNNRRHITFLQTKVLPRYGQPLYEVAEEERKAKAEKVAKTAPIPGAYRTKQAQKDDLEGLNRMYSKLREVITTLYLAIPHEQRDDLGQKVYYAVPHDLHQWRPKTSALVLKWNDGLADTVTKIEKLVAEREVIKARPVIK